MIIPAAMISVTNGCEDDDVTFINNTNPGIAGTTTWLWTFGDGTTSTDSVPTHQYQQPGTYTVTLQATNANSCSSVATATVIISPKPEADFQHSNPCEGQAVQFTDLSTISSGSITSYSWNFGDGSPVSSNQNPSHIYSASGTYNVTLIVTSDNGCVDSVTHLVTIYPTPVADFSSIGNAGCGPLPVSFFDSSFVQGGTIVSWSWDFGDGGTSSVQNPVHVYQHSGNYTVSLTVTSSNGCTSSYSINNLVSVYPGPYADFEPEPPVASILHPVINFNNLSSGAVSYTWHFGDGGMSNLFEPSHTYSDTGWYNVTLLVVNQYGCIDTITKPVYIQPEFTLWVPNCFTPNGDGKNDDFNIAGIGIVEMTMYIYNRWGDHIYTQNSLNSPWKGEVNNDEELAQQDVYVYDLIVKDVFGRTHTRIGHVSLIR
jgi:gliding motility-associated-like protein